VCRELFDLHSAEYVLALPLEGGVRFREFSTDHVLGGGKLGRELWSNKHGGKWPKEKS
jgi:hypothetical protein